MPEIIRYAMVGAGGYARLVNRLLSEIGGVTLVAACDPDADRARELGGSSDAAIYEDFNDLFDEQMMDAVFVCVPPFAHRGQEIEAAERGIHLYVAKPVALDYEYASEVDEAVDRSGIISCVSYGMRYAAPVQKARELLRDNPVCLAEGEVRLRVVPGSRRPWIARKELSRGQLFTQACHVYDIFRYLIGEVREVSAVKAEGFAPKSDEYDIEDAGIVTLKFAAGAIGQANCTVRGPSATGGTIAFRLTAEDLAVSYSNREGILHVAQGAKEWDFDMVMKGNEYDAVLLTRFLHAVRTGDRSGILTPYKDAVGSLRIALAACESLETGRPVSIR